MYGLMMQAVSGHQMLLAQLALGWRRIKPVTFSFHQLQKVSFDFFENSLNSSFLFASPATSANGFTHLLADVLTSELNKGRITKNRNSYINQKTYQPIFF